MMRSTVRYGFLLAVVLLTCSTRAQSLSDRILPLVKNHQGQVGVAITSLSSGESFRYHADEPMPTASLIKFPLMIAAYRDVDCGKLDLTRTLTLTEADKVPGSGILTPHFSAGANLSVRDAIRLMMAYSDNTATNLVIDEVGLVSVAELMETLDCPHTKLHSKVFRRDTSVFPDRSRQFGLGSTTAGEMVRLLQRLHRRELISDEASERMLEHMLACQSKDQIPLQLPAGTKVAHKTGAVSSVRCDAGIVFGPGEDAFAICVLTDENQDQRWSEDNAAQLLSAAIAKACYDHFFAAPSSESEAPQVLKLGSSGALVQALQRTLNLRITPSPGLAVDGDFGPNTQQTVIDFQLANDLRPTGEVGPETWSAMGSLIFEDAPVSDPDDINSLEIVKQPADAMDGPPHVTCKAWAIGDANTGELRWSDHGDDSLPMASTTKIMTAHIVLQLAEADPGILDETVTFSATADQTEGSTCELRAGEQISVHEMLYGLLLPSGNDASVALAEHFGPRVQSTDAVNSESSDPIDAVECFIAAMNRAAAELGMTSTQFRNTHGLTEPGHHSSARDLMTLACRAMTNPRFRQYVGTSQRGCTVTGPGGYHRNLQWRNTNRLLKINGYEGVKTGTTRAAGSCLVSYGTHNDDSLIVVVLGSSSSDARYADTRNLFRWGFTRASRASESSRGSAN